MEFLNPWALGSGIFLAVPIWLHLRDRSRPKIQDFPSLMLLQKGFPGAMRQQRIRNWLQLILRLALILCLTLVWSKPQFKKMGSPWQNFDRIIALVDNGIYGQIDYSNRNGLKLQYEGLATLSAAYHKPVDKISLIAALGMGATESRFGDRYDAYRRALALIQPHEQTLLVIPIFDWTKAQVAQSLLENAVSKNPNLRILLWDLNASTALPPPPTLTPRADSNTGQWKIELHQKRQTAGITLKSTLDGKPWRLLTLENDTVTFELPKTQPGWHGLTLKPEKKIETDSSVSNIYLAWMETKPKRVLHLGSGLFSYPSLGLDVLGRMPLALVTANELKDSLQGEMNGIGAVTLAGMTPPTEVLERLAAWVLGGGHLILTVGLHSDLAALNSRLLGPLRMGQLLNLESFSIPKPLDLQRNGLAKFGVRAPSYGSSATVSRYFSYQLDTATQALVTAEGHPILMGSKPGKGSVLLWATDVDSVSWTDVGLSPLMPLYHQSFLKGLSGGPEWNCVATDSVFVLDEPGESVQVFTPQGTLLNRITSEGGSKRIGPFPQPGFYQIKQGDSSQMLAVNLLDLNPMAEATPSTAALSFGPEFRIEKELGATAQTTSVPKVMNLLLPLAVLLLLIDGLLSLVLAAQVPTPSKTNPFERHA